MTDIESLCRLTEAEGDKRGRSHQSALFVFDGSDRWHKIGHSVVV